MSQRRLLITGASGWLGKSLISSLLTKRNKFDDILLVGSSNKFIFIDNKKLSQLSWEMNEVSRFSPTHVFHLAALTRDKLQTMPIDAYVKEYALLNNLFSETIGLPSVEKVVLVSSGAADLLKFPSNLADPYSLEKNREERIAKSFISAKKKVNILRIYSVTGRFINKIQKLAFSNFIFQAKYKKKVNVLAENLVYRQYIDAEELMEASLNLFDLDSSSIYNSGGIKIEMRDLARLIAQYFSIGSERILLKEIKKPIIDDYTSDEDIVPGVEVTKIATLQQQIKITSQII